MLTEQGVVIELNQNLAMVQTLAKTGCNSCKVNTSCGTGIISKAFGERSFVTPMANIVNAKVGDEVEVGIPESLVIKASFLVYLLPLMLMLLVTFFSWSLAPSNEPLIIISAVVGLFSGFLLARYFARGIDQKSNNNNRLSPVLLRIVNRPIAVKHIETS